MVFFLYGGDVCVSRMVLEVHLRQMLFGLRCAQERGVLKYGNNCHRLFISAQDTS